MIKNTFLIVFLAFAIIASVAHCEDWKPGLQPGQNPPAKGQPQNPGAQPANPQQNMAPIGHEMSGSSAGATQQNTMPMMGPGMGMGKGRMCGMGATNNMGAMNGSNSGATQQNTMSMMGPGMGGSGTGCPMMGGGTGNMSGMDNKTGNAGAMGDMGASSNSGGH